MRLAVVAVILASCALLITVAQPTYNFLAALINQVNDQPSFQISMLNLDEFVTNMILYNNATTAAHHVEVRLYFIGPNMGLGSIEHISDLQKNGRVAYISFPIGEFQLEYGGWNVTQYTLNFDILCDELSITQPAHFSYNAKPGYIII